MKGLSAGGSFGRTARITAGLLGGVSLFAIAGSAAAQTGTAASDEVVVTGSRVIKNGNNSPTPVSVVSVQDMQAVQPTPIADNLNAFPVFAGSRTQFGNPNGGGGNGAANQLNMRNLGSNRNLVLFDGHRVPATLTDGSVDIDMVPQLLLQRVDVVTGGVSAVYGSDAISGVINFIPDKTFTGLKLQAQAGVSQYGDDRQQDIGIAVGTRLLDGRGHFEASYEHRNDEGILYRSARPYNYLWAVGGLGTTASPFVLVGNDRLQTSTFGGLITSGVLSGMNFKSNGVLTPYQHGVATGAGCCEVGGDGAYYNDSLKAPLRTDQFFARFDYDFGSGWHGYAQAGGDMKRNAQYLNPPILSNVTISSTNAYLPAAYQAQLAAAKQTSFKLSEFMQDAQRQVDETLSNQYMVSGGLDGKISGFDVDLFVLHGWTEQRTYFRNNTNNQRLSAALDAVVNPANGQIVCNVTLTNPGADPGCAPLNVFGPTAADPTALAYVQQDTEYVTRQTMDDVEGSISGSPFALWAGPLNMAVSGEWRKISRTITSNFDPSLLNNCTGLRFNCSATGTLYAGAVAASPLVSQSVAEGAVEADIPLIKDAPFIQALSINGAARYTSYSTSGDYTTWKIGVDWRVDDTLTLRATRSRDIRAPTLNDLFAPVSVQLFNSQDFLTGLSPANVPLYAGGNRNLQSEIGETTTAGFVWKPRFLPGFSLAVDGFDIRITNAIANEQGTLQQVQLGCYASGGTSPYCALIQRPFPITNTTAANVVTAWYGEQINIASVETYGLDLEANYAGRLFDRPFTARVLTSWVPHLRIIVPTLSDFDQAGVAYTTNPLYPTPNLSLTGLLHFSVTDQLAVDVMERWRAPLTMKDGAQVWTNPNVAAFATTNLTVTYSIPRSQIGKVDVFLNMQNLFNANPPRAAFFSHQTPGDFGGWALGDDIVGRYFTVGARLRY
jgi:outer membrane receptor protein involved in Fe transport